MTITVIESKDKALLDAFRAGNQLADDQSETPSKVEQGRNKTGSLHWLIIENSMAEDNATYRLTRKGLRFAMSGVEI